MPTQGIPIQFLVLNGQRPLTLDFNTFCSSTGLDYKNGKYVAPPTPEVVKKELRCEIWVSTQHPNQKDIVSSLLFSGKKNKVKSQTVTPILPKLQGLEALESLSQKRKKPLSKKAPKETKATPPTKPTEGYNYDLRVPSTASNEGTAKTTPRLEGELRDKESEGNKPPADMEPIHPTVADPSGTGAEYQVDETKYTRLRTKHEESVVSYADIKASIEGYYEENIDYREQTDKLVKATMDSLDKTATDKVNLLNALNGVTETLKAVQHAVKDDPAINKKVIKATEAYPKIHLPLLNYSALQDEHLASWAKSSNSLAWNLGPRMTSVESSQDVIRSDISSLKQDTSKIKSMMTEIYQVFKGQASTPSTSIPPTTLAIFELPATIKGENDTQANIEEPPSHTEGEHVAMEDDKAEEEPTREVALIESSSKPPLTDPILKIPVPQREGKAIAIDDQPEVQTKLMPSLKEVCPDPDALILVPYEINGKVFQLIEEQIQAHMDKEEQI
ncbi:hypothetical protein Tco_0366515 [Tanacetum coccineum]